MRIFLTVSFLLTVFAVVNSQAEDRWYCGKITGAWAHQDDNFVITLSTNPPNLLDSCNPKGNVYFHETHVSETHMQTILKFVFFALRNPNLEVGVVVSMEADKKCVGKSLGIVAEGSDQHPCESKPFSSPSK